MEFKDRIKARRLQLGLTTDDVAKLVGVSNATISRWETGVITNQRRDKIELLANALQTTPAELMGWGRNPDAIDWAVVESFPDYGLGKETIPEYQDRYNKDIRVSRLFELFCQLNDEGQEKVTDYADDLVNSGKYIKRNADKLSEEA